MRVTGFPDGRGTGIIELAGDGAFDFEVVREASYQKALEDLAGGRWEEEADVLCRARLLELAGA
jgi:hypothetical protein